MVYEVATLVYQASLLSTTMMAHPDVSPTAVFKIVATMCKLGSFIVAKVVKTNVQVEEAKDMVQRLLLAATHVKTMLIRPALKGHP